MITIREVVKSSGLPTETTRRYLKQFSEFCPSKRDGRRILYDDDVVGCVVRVRSLYDQGLGTEEIRDALARELAPPSTPRGSRGGISPAVLDRQQKRIVALEEEVRYLRNEVEQRDRADKEMASVMGGMREEIAAMKEERDRGFWKRLRDRFGGE